MMRGGRQGWGDGLQVRLPGAEVTLDPAKDPWRLELGDCQAGVAVRGKEKKDPELGLPGSAPGLGRPGAKSVRPQFLAR